jgi:hypothetical protein
VPDRAAYYPMIFCPLCARVQSEWRVLDHSTGVAQCRDCNALVRVCWDGNRLLVTADPPPSLNGVPT